MATPDAEQPVPSLRGTLIRGSMWMVAMRWIIRGIGLVSTVILARLLVPADFGILAMATLIVGLLDVLFAFGVEVALIQNTDADREHWDTAWTIRVLQGVAVALLMLLGTRAAAAMFDEPRVATVLPLLAVGVFLRSFENIGVVAFRKDLEFAREFRFMVFKRILTFVVTIGLALFLRSYWALAIGIVAGNAIGTLLSYRLHPYRPRFRLSRFREIWSFSQWMILITVGNYVRNKGDQLIVGSCTGTGDMGTYSVSSELANLPTTELIAPMARALFPGYSRLRHDRDRFNASYLNVLGVMSTFAVAAGVGIGVVADSLIPVLLGPKWLAAIPLVQVLALYGALSVLFGSAGTSLMALGRVRLLAAFTWIETATLLSCLWIVIRVHGLLGLTVAKLLLATVTTILYFEALASTSSIRRRDLFRRIWRPFAASAAMAGGVFLVRPLLDFPALARLATTVSLGTVMYVAVLLLLWRIAGSPRGAETFVLETIRSRLERTRRV